MFLLLCSWWCVFLLDKCLSFCFKTLSPLKKTSGVWRDLCLLSLCSDCDRVGFLWLALSPLVSNKNLPWSELASDLTIIGCQSSPGSLSGFNWHNARCLLACSAPPLGKGWFGLFQKVSCQRNEIVQTQSQMEQFIL